LRLAAALVVTVALLGGGVRGGAVAGTAARTLFVSTTGSDGTCTRAAPCATFAHAYRVARAGQTVEVAAGAYAPQSIPVDPSKTSLSDVVFRPATGATVVIGCPDTGTGCIDIFGSHVTIENMHIASLPRVNGYPWQGTVDTERGSTDVTLVDIDAGSLNAAASNLTVRGGDWGPSIDPHNMRIVDECVNCTFDGLFIHDFAVAQGGHMECLTFDGGTNVTIRDSEFRSCADFAIFAKPYGEINGALIENDVFWNPRGFDQSNDIKFTSDGGGSCANIVIRFNLVSDDINDDCGNVAVVGDIQLARQQSCGPGWDANLFVDVQGCGVHARRVSDARFADQAAGDFHLLPGSPAIGAGPPVDFPGTDKDGHRRPAGARPDAGPYEAPAPPRPKGIPSRIPGWAFTLYRWLSTPTGRRGERPAAAPKHLPPWFRAWQAWRLELERS